MKSNIDPSNKTKIITTDLLVSQVEQIDILRKEKGILKNHFFRSAVANELKRIKEYNTSKIELNLIAERENDFFDFFKFYLALYSLFSKLYKSIFLFTSLFFEILRKLRGYF